MAWLITSEFCDPFRLLCMLCSSPAIRCRHGLDLPPSTYLLGMRPQEHPYSRVARAIRSPALPHWFLHPAGVACRMWRNLLVRLGISVCASLQAGPSSYHDLHSRVKEKSTSLQRSLLTRPLPLCAFRCSSPPLRQLSTLLPQQSRPVSGSRHNTATMDPYDAEGGAINVRFQHVCCPFVQSPLSCVCALHQTG